MTSPSDGMADETDSKSVDSNVVWVQVPPRAPKTSNYACRLTSLFDRIQ